MQAGLAVFAAFNLVCDVQRFGDDVSPALSARTLTYRIDPTLGRWCEGTCPAAQPIAAITPAEIVLSYRGADGHAGPGQAIRIDAIHGYRENSVDPDGAEQTAVVGRCHRAPFSGFPAESLRFAVPLRVAVPTFVGRIRPAATPR